VSGRSQFLLQMAGTPGAGKSVLAAGIGRATGAVVLDHDVTKSALLDGGVAWNVAGPAAYRAGFAVARELLRQGHDVILDSACHYADVVANGERAAAEAGVAYRFIECLCPDDAELVRRRSQRPRRRSQLAGATEFSADARDHAPSAAEPIDHLRWRTHRPAAGGLAVDATRAPSECLADALRYLGVR
jgi:predicted kinase